MPSTSTSLANRELQAVLEFGALTQVSDAELLLRLRSERGSADAAAAFRLIVLRHGPMVLGVCRRILQDVHASEDAFQSTFQILAGRAGSLSIDDSVGPWLHGVSTRVARRMRAKRSFEQSRISSVGNIQLADPGGSPDTTQGPELRAILDQEISRLPARDRQVVTLCLLGGESYGQAASSLNCPIGTVQSRLHRARERLKTALTRRGVAPAAIAGGLTASSLAEAHVSPLLADATASLLGKGSFQLTTTSLTLLVQIILGRIAMFRTATLGLLLLGLLCTASIAFQSPAANKEAPPPQEVVAPTPKPATGPSIADEFARIKAEYDAKQNALVAALEKVDDQAESIRLLRKLSPNELEFSRRMVDLALKNPADKASRDALVWVMHKPFMSDNGPYADEFERAAALLLRHHGDDPDAIRVGLQFHNVPTARRDALLHGFLASAKSHESKGLARAALARFLELKGLIAKGARKSPLRTTLKIPASPGQEARELPVPSDEQAYQLLLRECDGDYILAEAEKLYEELVKDYADVPYKTQQRRQLADLLKDPDPKFQGKALTSEQRIAIEKTLATTLTLAEFARGRLDEMHNFSIGKPAPEIEGLDLKGQPLKLSDYRGKVVFVVFWATWCGPCVAEIPHENALAARLKGKPFVILGVNVDEKSETALDFIKKEKVDWLSWFDGHDNPKIVKRYHVEKFPSSFLIDAKGNLRSKDLRGERLDTEVDKLLAEMEAPKKP